MANLTLSEKRKQRNTGNQAAGESSGGLSLSLAQKRALNNAGTLREEPEPYKATAEDLMQRNYWLQSTSGIRAGMRDRALTPSLKDSDVLFPEVVPVSRRRVGTGEAGEAARTISPDRVGPVDAREIVEMPSKEETDALLEDALGFLEKHANDGKPTENPLTAGRPNLFVSQAEPKPVPQSMRVGADEIATTDEQSEAERQARMRELYDSVYSPEDRARIDEQNAQIDKEMEDWWAEVDKTYEGIRQRNPDVIYSGLDLQELQQSPDYRAKAEAGKANKGNKVEQALQMYNMAMQTPYFRKNGDNDYFTAQDLNSMGRDILPLQAASEARDKGYIHMTQGMRDMYAYLLEAYGPKVADRYLAQLGDDLQTIEAQKRVEDMYKETGNAFRDSDIGKFLRTANTALESGANQPVTGWTRFINQMTGNTYHQPGDISQNVSQLVKENLSADENGIKIFGKPIGRVAYDLLETTASQWPQILTGGILGGNQVQTLIPMVLQVAGNDYDDMISQGYDQESAQWHAFLTALTEYGTEIIGGVGFISGGTLTEDATEEIIRLMKPGVLKLAASLGINMAGEGVEEFISGTIGPLTDAVTKGEKPEWNWQDIGYEAALGGLSGLTMGAPVEVGQFISEQSGVRAVNNTAQGLATAENMASVLREGMLAYGMDEATADKYAPLAEKLINGETMTPEELMDLASNTPVAEFVNDVTERYYKEHPNETEAPEEISIDTYRARGEAASQKAIRDTARAYEGAADQADVIKKGMVAYGIEDGTAEKLAGIASRLINGENVSEEDVRMLANYTPAAEFLDEVMKTIENPQWHNVGTGEEIRREAKPELPQEPTEQTYEAPEAAPRAEQQKPELPAEQTYEAPKAEQQKPEIQTEQTYEAPESETEAETTVQTEPGKNVGEGQQTRQRPRMLTADELRARLEESRSARMSPEEFKAYVEKAKGTYTNKGMREQLAEMKTRRGEREATRRDRDSIITVNNTEVSVDSIDVGENGTVTLHLGTGETAKLGDKGVNIGTGETAKAIAIASKLGVDGKRFFEIYRKGQTAQKVSDFLAEYDQAYTFGKNNVPITENIRNGFGTLTPEQIEDAYADGKAQAAKPEAETPANKIGDPANAKEGTVDTTGIRGVSLTAQQKASVEASKTIAQALGIDVVWYASETDENGKRVGANGKYDTQTGKIYLDIYAGSNFKNDLQTAALSTMSHELTHFIEQWNPTEYAKLRGMVFDYLGKQNVDIADLIERKRARSAHGTISTDVAIQEIVADGMEMMLADSKAITEYSQQDKTLWQKIKGKISEFIGNIRKAFEGVAARHTEAKALMRDVNGAMQYLDGLQEQWDRALTGASRNYRMSPERQQAAAEAPRMTRTQEQAAKNGAPMTMSYEKVAELRGTEKGKPGVTYATKAITREGDLPMQMRRQAQVLSEIGKKYNIEFVIHDEISGGALDGVYITGNAIHIAMNGASNGILAAGVHETVHYIRGLSEESFTELSDGVANILGQVDYETAWKARMQNEGLDEDTAREEVIAEALPAIFGNEKVMERFVERHPDVASKFAKHLREFVNYVRGVMDRLGGAKRHAEIAKMLNAADEQATKLLDNYEKALAEAQRRAEEIGYTGYIDPNHTNTGVTVKESKSTLGAWEANLRAQAKEIGTKEAIARAESVIESVMNFVNRAKDSAMAWQFLQSGMMNPYADRMGPLRNNVEYVYSFDPDTNCWRQADYARIKRDIENRLGRKMTVPESQNLTTLMHEFGWMIPCRYCYLYTKRALLDEAYTGKIREAYVLPILGQTFEDGQKRKKAVNNWLKKNPEGAKAANKLVEDVYYEVEAARRVIFNWLDDTFNVSDRYVMDTDNAVRMFVMPQVKDGNKMRNVKPEEMVAMVAEHFGLSLDKRVNKSGKKSTGPMVTWLTNLVGEWVNDQYINKDHNIDELARPNGMKGDLPADWKPDNRLLQIHAASFLSAENGIKANLPKDYAPYEHQIWNIKDRDMLNIIAHDGIRFQSSTDFRIENVLDYMQILADMAAYEKDLWDDAKQKWVHVKGLNGHMYTKSELCARILAPSGLHINCSVAFDGDTIGNIRPASQESMNLEDAIDLSAKYKNVGVMAMVTNPAQLAYALELYRADENGNRKVHMIIPFHASGLNETYFGDVMGWKDYTATQNETFRTEQQMREKLEAAGIKIPANYKKDGVASLYYKRLANTETALFQKAKNGKVKRVTPHFLPEDSIMIGCDANGNEKAYTIPGHHNDYDTYIKLCEQYDVNPRFYNIEVPNIKGGGTRKIIDDPETYMAVIHESRADAPKDPVKADFDTDYAVQQLDLAAQRDTQLRERYAESKNMPEAERLAIRQANRQETYYSFGIGKMFVDAGLIGETRRMITQAEADVRKAAGIKIDNKKILVMSDEDVNERMDAVKEANRGLITGQGDMTRFSEREEEAEKHFGTTDDYNVAGYITSNGSMLDFSGKHWGARNSRQRTVEHYDISEIYEDDIDRADAQRDFIANGAIRVAPENGGIEIAKEPTKRQYDALRGFIGSHNGEVTLDIVDGNERAIESMDWPRGTSAGVILGDIRKYFENGTVPATRSITADFRYQPREDDQISDRELLANALASTARTVEEKNNIVNYKRRIAYLNVMQDHADGLLRRINSGKLTPEQYRAAEADYVRTMNGIALQDKALLKLEAAKPLQQVLVRERQKATEQAKARADKRIESVREAQKTQYERKTERMLAKVEQYREAYAAEKEKARLDRIEMRQKVAAAKQAGAAAAKQAVAAERERAERVEEHQARIEKIRKAVKRLNQTLTAPDNTHFVPDEMRDAVKDMMEVFLNDTSVFDRSRLNNLKTAYEHMFTSDADRGSTLYDPDIEEKIDTLGQTILNRRLSQLGNYELQMVQDIVDHMNFLLSEADKVFVEGRKQDAAELAAKIKIEAADAGEKTTVPWMRRTIEFLREGNVTPIYFFRRMGGTMEKLFKGFLEGETKWAKQMQKTREYFEATTKKYHYWDWADVKGDTLKFETSFGDNIELTRQQAMALWATRVREYNNPMQNAKHLEDGGFVYDKPQKATKKKLGIFTAETENQKAHRLNDDDIKVIADWLTDEQRDFVMEMCRYLSQDMSELGNETSKQLHGYSKFLEKFYYPYKSSKTFMASEPGKAEAAMLKNVGFSKALTQSAKNPIIATDFVKTWADHCTQMIMYNAMAKAQDDFMRVYNHKVSSTAKTGYESVKESLINAYGQEATRYIETLMQDMYGGINRGYGDSLGKWVNKFKKGATFASLSVAIQQPSAIMRAMAMVDPRYFVQTMRFSRNKAASEMMKYAGTAIIKRMGRFDMNSGKSSAEWLAANNTDDMEFRQKLKQFVNRKDSSYRDDILSKMPEKMDEITWAHIWLACKAETAAKTGLTGEALLQATGQRFDEVARRTQVYDSVLVRSQVMRDQGMFPKMFTAFMAEPTLTYNMMLDAAMNAKKGPEGRRFAAKAGAALVGQIVLNTLLKSIITAMRDKDDDKTYLEKYAAHVVSSLLGTPLNDKMGPVSAVVGALSSEFSPMTMIPLAQDVLNIFNGYDVERSDMSLVNDLYDATKDLYNDKKTGYEKTRSFAGAVAAFFGLPVKNVWRDIDGAINTATSKAINTTTGQGIKYAIMEEMGYNNAYTTNVTRLYLAALRGDDQEMKRLRDHIKADLKNSKGENYTDKDINSKLTSMIKEDYLDGNETRSDTVKMLQKIAGVNGDDEAKALVYSWEKAEIKEDYQEGSMSAAEAQKALIDRAGVEKDEAPKMVRQWEVTAETDSSSPYARVWGYISKWDGSKLKAEIKELKNLGYTDTGITSSITAHFKDEYVAASKSQRATLKAHLIEAYKLVGYTQDKAAAKIDKWLED